jgi:outer membrane receptor protein involved in Fe transport
MTTMYNMSCANGLLSAASLCVASSGCAVQAQTLDEVVISASRSEQRSFDAPAAVQGVARETIQAAGPQVNLSESLARVPGLTILDRQNYAQDLQVSIRGFGARSAFGIRGVRLLIDGIPATTPDGQGQGSSISLPSTERIEVLRGPLALMYGNSSGGVIQAFTREAPEQPEFDAQYYAGSFGMHRNDLQFASRIGEGLGAVGLVADYSTFDTNGYRDLIGRGGHDRIVRISHDHDGIRANTSASYRSRRALDEEHIVRHGRIDVTDTCQGCGQARGRELECLLPSARETQIGERRDAGTATRDTRCTTQGTAPSGDRGNHLNPR